MELTDSRNHCKSLDKIHLDDRLHNIFHRALAYMFLYIYYRKTNKISVHICIQEEANLVLYTHV